MQSVIVHEVGLRDGLQIEKTVVSTEKKLEWTGKLMEAGIPVIQLGSFVHPKKVPQMADTDELFKQVIQSDKPDHVTLSGLVLNERGLERGLECGVEMFCMGVSASNTHSRKNTGMTTKEALQRIIPMARQALQQNKSVQVSVQSAFGCGYEGEIKKKSVLDIIKAYLDAGLTMVSLADTAGMGKPEQVYELFQEIFGLSRDVECACHFHNTRGQGIANCEAALNAGVTWFESAFGGLGGCPFTKTTSGNVSTEEMVTLLKQKGFVTEIDLEKVINLVRSVNDVIPIASFRATKGSEESP
jgi:hydroxymethylglutaryl-CoA lyase